MVSRRVQTEKLGIEEVREPGDRVPIQSGGRAKSPNDGAPTESGSDLRIVGNVNRVVVIEKGSAGDRVVERKSGKNEEQAEDQSAFLRELKNMGSNRMLAGLWLRQIHGFHQTCSFRGQVDNPTRVMKSTLHRQ